MEERDCNDCEFLNLSEADQDHIKKSGGGCPPHICTKYNERVRHYPYKEPYIRPLKECIEEEDIQRAVEALQRLTNAIAEVLNPIIDKTWEAFKKIMDAVLHTYPNKKVLHLAMRHPKERVRKKNMRRIMRWIEREGKK